MNQLSGAEAFLRMLQRHGVTHVFGLCGDTSLPLYDALARLNHGITHILTRDERSAAYMADGYARISGKVGVCEGPSGGGATYILPGVAEANESSVPLLAVTTDISTTSRGRFTLTELDQAALFRPVTKWNRVIDRAAAIPQTLRSAFTQMTTGRPGAVHLGLPFDVQKDPVDEADVWADPALNHCPSSRTGPDPNAVDAAADLVIFVGCRAGSVTTERWRHPKQGTPVIHIDVDAAVMGANYRAEAALIGDARLSLAALHDALQRRGKKANGAWAIEPVARAKRDKGAAFRELALSDATPIRPERLVAELQAVLPDDAIVVADPGTPCPYLSAYYEIRQTGRHLITNRAHGALGYSLPAVIGAYYARPSTKCVAVMGDGAFGFSVGEMETLVRLNLPITLIVISNSGYGWIKAGQRTGFGGRYHQVDFTTSDHGKIAAAYGLKSWRVTNPAELRRSLQAAVESSGPTLVDVVTQPLHEARAPVSEWIA